MRRFAASLCRTSALAAVLTLAVASPAAAETIAPPGNSGVDQYFEVVPSAKGNSKPNGKRKALPQKVRSELANHGETGRQLQRVVETNTPSPSRKRDRKPTASAPAPAPRGDSPLSSAAKAIADSDGGGMGIALPALLIVSTAVLAAVALRRRRSA